MAYFDYETVMPTDNIAPYVEYYWRLHNIHDEDKAAVIMPDGRIDLIFSKSVADPFHTTLIGISVNPEKITLEQGLEMFGVSFKLPAAEYILHRSISGLVNSAQRLPAEFWNVTPSDMASFEKWCIKISTIIDSRIPICPDQRKLKLFDHLYATHGSLSISQYAEHVRWNSRQINRYFNQQFGLPMKTYCEVLRFRAGVGHIQYGKLYPEENYTDQSHFIKEVKKLSGVSPKKLYKNEHEAYIQLLVPPIS